MKTRRVLFWLILLILAGLELALSWKVQGFSDFYAEHIMPVWVATYGRGAGVFDFSTGEFLIYGGVIYVCFTLLIWMSRFVAFVEGKDKLKKLSRANTKIFFKIIILVALLQVQNCFVFYHTTPLFQGTSAEEYQPNREDLIALREMLVIKANELSENFERNSKGEIVYEADFGSIAKISMQGIGEAAKKRVEAGDEQILDNKLKLLSGYYSQPKPFYKSDFFSQQSIMGYYFPFTLEANYNDLMYITNIPYTMCHELSHLKGFIYEDEANFLAYVGCISSEDNFFVYSGILGVLSYVNTEVKRELAVEPDIRNSLTPINELVEKDSVFLTKEAWAEVEGDAWFETEKVSEASDTFLETNLTLNGVSDGLISYSRVVNLLLKYYYGKG